MPYDQEDTYQGYAATSQGMPKIANHYKVGRGKEWFPYRFQRECGFADTFLLDFQPPEP